MHDLKENSFELVLEVFTKVPFVTRIQLGLSETSFVPSVSTKSIRQFRADIQIEILQTLEEQKNDKINLLLREFGITF